MREDFSASEDKNRGVKQVTDRKLCVTCSSGYK